MNWFHTKDTKIPRSAPQKCFAIVLATRRSNVLDWTLAKPSNYSHGGTNSPHRPCYVSAFTFMFISLVCVTWDFHASDKHAKSYYGLVTSR
jgi:hypothetical protein